MASSVRGEETRVERLAPVHARGALTAIALGGALTVVGASELGSAYQADRFCRVMSDLQTLAGTLAPRVNEQAAAASCGAEDWRLREVTAAVLVGTVLGVVGCFVLIRRARRSANGGAPWQLHSWLHRRTDRADAFIAKLAGPPRNGPRIGIGLVSGLLVLAIIVVGGVVVRGLQDYQTAATADRHREAQADLVTLSLPTRWIRGSTQTCFVNPDTICAHSGETREQALSGLATLLDGSTAPAPCAALLTDPLSLCPIHGTIDGYPAVGFAFPHLLPFTGGTPPAGAVPVKPGKTTLYSLGSDVTIELVTPG